MQVPLDVGSHALELASTEDQDSYSPVVLTSLTHSWILAKIRVAILIPLTVSVLSKLSNLSRA